MINLKNARDTFFFFLAAVFLKLSLPQTKISGEQKCSNALPHFIFCTACKCLYEHCVKIQINVIPQK